MSAEGKATAVLLRDARPEEIESLSELIRDAYSEYQPHYPPERWHPYIQGVGELRGRPGEFEVIVAELDGKTAGVVLFYPDGRQSGQGEWPEGWAGILRLAVHPSARGRGAGRALVEECLQRCRQRGIRTAGLHTTEWMAIARAMYERMGFVRVPEFDFHPRPGVVGYCYKIDLS